MLISEQYKILAFILLFVGIALSVASLFVFSVGWETSNVITAGLGAISTVASLFLFAMGWDRLQAYRNSGQISGKLDFPNLEYSLTFYPSVSVSNVDGSNRTLIPNRSDGRFELSGVMPGEYYLSVEGYGLTTVTRPVTILPRRRRELDSVPLEFDAQQFWREEVFEPFHIGHSLHINHVGPGPDQNAWAAGFSVDRSYHDEYKLFRRQVEVSAWQEVIVPQFNKRASRTNMTKLFSDGTFLGGGAVLSEDGGRSWRSIEIPGIDSVSHIIELPGGAWLLAGFKHWIEQPNPSLLIARSSDRGGSWDMNTLELGSGDNVKRMFLTFSGRLLAGTESLYGSGSILFSNDLGETWEKAEIDNPKKLRSIRTLYELRNGDLLAGNEDGRNWKGNFYRGGQLLVSRDGGLSWHQLAERGGWQGVKGIYENASGALFVWADPESYIDPDENEYIVPEDLLLSSDRGKTWHPFSRTFGRGFEETYGVVENEIFVVSDKDYSSMSLLVTSTDILDLRIR